MLRAFGSLTQAFGRRTFQVRRSLLAGLRLAPRALALLGLVAVLSAGGRSLAQDAGEQEAGPAGPNAPAFDGGVLIINMQRVFREADAARSIQKQAEEIRESIQQQLATYQESLRDEEQELVALRQTLPPAEFSARVEDFETRVRALKRASSERGSTLQKALFDANEELKKRLRPELIAIMQERSAAIMLDERNVVISARALDVTGEAIERLNASTPKIAIVWSDTDWTPDAGSVESPAADGSTERSQSGDTGTEDAPSAGGAGN